MIKLKTVKETIHQLEEVRKKGKSVGFVPTMGALHEGHLSLIREAKNENDFVVSSIFINPIQFNNKNDLVNYPKDLNKDIDLLLSADTDLLFLPTEEEMYPEPVTEVFDFGGLDEVLEGKFRPGHFKGVAIVVKRLFEIIKPDKAYFGLKDYQQLLIIHRITKNYHLPVEIIPCPTIREDDGLAMSSRNQLLSKQERKQAILLYEVLKMVKIQSGFSSINEVKTHVDRLFRKTKDVKLEYFEIVDMYTLEPLKAWAQSKNVIACVAAWVGNVRLIDNIILFS
jgi:pantoate--beta-alanine ligase